jgi:hypothetical protein
MMTDYKLSPVTSTEAETLNDKINAFVAQQVSFHGDTEVLKELLNISKNKCPKMCGLYGDVRTIEFNETVDAIVEWWCLFHLPKSDHELMIARFAQWLKPASCLDSKKKWLTIN